MLARLGATCRSSNRKHREVYLTMMTFYREVEGVASCLAVLYMPSATKSKKPCVSKGRRACSAFHCFLIFPRLGA